MPIRLRPISSPFLPIPTPPPPSPTPRSPQRPAVRNPSLESIKPIVKIKPSTSTLRQVQLTLDPAVHNSVTDKDSASISSEPRPWATPSVDRLVCALDARDLGAAEIIHRVKTQFPELQPAIITANMVDNRILILDQRVELDYFKHGLGLGARSVENGIGGTRGARHGALIHAMPSMESVTTRPRTPISAPRVRASSTDSGIGLVASIDRSVAEINALGNPSELSQPEAPKETASKGAKHGKAIQSTRGILSDKTNLPSNDKTTTKKKLKVKYATTGPLTSSAVEHDASRGARRGKAIQDAAGSMPRPENNAPDFDNLGRLCVVPEESAPKSKDKGKAKAMLGASPHEQPNLGHMAGLKLVTKNSVQDLAATRNAWFTSSEPKVVVQAPLTLNVQTGMPVPGPGVTPYPSLNGKKDKGKVKIKEREDMTPMCVPHRKHGKHERRE